MSRETEQKLEEWARWWDEHKRDGGDVEQKYKMLLKQMEGFFDLAAMIVRDLQGLEGRPKTDLGQPLYLPGQMRVRGDMRRVG